MATYGRDAVAGTLMQRGSGLFGGGMGGWRGGMSSTAPQNSPWGAGMMQGASGSPQSGIFGKPQGLGGNMPGMSGRNPMAGVNGNWGGNTGSIGTVPPTTVPTPPPVPMATPAPTSSLGQPATQPTLGNLGGPITPSTAAPPNLDWAGRDLTTGAGGQIQDYLGNPPQAGGTSRIDDSGMWRSAGLSSPTSSGGLPPPAFIGRASPEQFAAMNAPQGIFGDWGGSSGGIGRRADGSSFAPVPLTGQFQD